MKMTLKLCLKLAAFTNALLFSLVIYKIYVQWQLKNRIIIPLDPMPIKEGTMYHQNQYIQSIIVENNENSQTNLQNMIKGVLEYKRLSSINLKIIHTNKQSRTCLINQLPINYKQNSYGFYPKIQKQQKEEGKRNYIYLNNIINEMNSDVENESIQILKKRGAYGVQKQPESKNEVDAPQEFIEGTRRYTQMESSYLQIETEGMSQINFDQRLIMNLHSRTAYYYIASLYFGIKRAKYNLLLDTGSSWIWVANSACKNCQSDKMKILDCYEFDSQIAEAENIESKKNQSNDATFTKTEENCSIQSSQLISVQYAIGGIEGNLASDSVTFRNEQDQRSININFLSASRVNSTIIQPDFDGFLGLSPASDKNNQTLLKALHQSKSIDRQLFSLYISKDVIKIQAKSHIQLGRINYAQIYNKEVEFYRIQDVFRWRLGVELMAIQNQYIKSRTLLQDVPRSAFLDSGSSLLILNTEDFNNFNQFLQNNQVTCTYENYNFWCQCQDGRVDRFPTFEFQFKNGITPGENQIFTLEPQFYVTAVDYMCLLMIQQFDLPLNKYQTSITVLGLPFFRKYYTVFDIENSAIGFAESDHNFSIIVEKTNYLLSAAIFFLILGTIMFLLLKLYQDKVKM